MRAKKWWLGGFGALVIAGATALFMQRQTAVELRSRIAQMHASDQVSAIVRSEHERLVRSQESSTELENLRADHEAVARLRGEIEALKVQASRPVPPRPVAAARIADVDPATAAAMAALAVPEKGWKNAGRATPGAAMETALSAATDGDLDALASTFVLEGAARVRAEAILSGLPEATRAQYGTPEKLVALFTARDVPISVRLGGAGGGTDDMKLLLRLQPAEGGIKETNVALRRSPDGWRLVVPEAAVEKYAAILAGGTMPSGGK